MADLQYQHNAPPKAAMSPEEAQAVMKLWNERQQELHAMPSVGELSEVLNAPPDQVARLLDEVRQNQVMAKRKKRSFPIRSVAIVAAVAMLMAASGTFGWLAGHASGKARALYPQGYSIPSIPSAASPAGYRVTFDGYSLPKGNVRLATEATLQQGLEDSVQAAIRQMSPNPGYYSGPQIALEDLATTLSTDKAIPGVLDFRKASIKGPGGEVEAVLPILITSSAEINALVYAEQARRIKQMVSKVIAQ